MHMALHTGMPGFNPSMYGGLPPQGPQMAGDFNLYGQAGMMPGAGGGGMMASSSDPAGSGLLAGAGPGSSSPMGSGLLGGGLGSTSMTDFSLLESKPSTDNLHARMASNSESTGAPHDTPRPTRRFFFFSFPCPPGQRRRRRRRRRRLVCRFRRSCGWSHCGKGTRPTNAAEGRLRVWCARKAFTR